MYVVLSIYYVIYYVNFPMSTFTIDLENLLLCRKLL